jgi:hypothetical protein
MINIAGPYKYKSIQSTMPVLSKIGTTTLEVLSIHWILRQSNSARRNGCCIGKYISDLSCWIIGQSVYYAQIGSQREPSLALSWHTESSHIWVLVQLLMHGFSCIYIVFRSIEVLYSYALGIRILLSLIL